MIDALRHNTGRNCIGTSRSFNGNAVPVPHSLPGVPSMCTFGWHPKFQIGGMFDLLVGTAFRFLPRAAHTVPDEICGTVVPLAFFPILFLPRDTEVAVVLSRSPRA